MISKRAIISLLLFCSLIFIYGTAYCSTFPFDEYAVFCSYFKMSGDKPSDQDVEELCFMLDRPAYTSFKPSEMFSKKSLNKEKDRVDKIIDSITGNSAFLWKVKYNLSNNRDINKYFSKSALNEILPQPTPYINSRISGKGQRKIKKAIASLLKNHSEKLKNRDLEIIITLKPEKSEHGYQKRNIVEQNVVLPIRYVIFQPTKVQILDELEPVE